MAEILSVRQSHDLMLALIAAMDIPHEGRAIKRVTLVLECDDVPKVYVELYLPGADYVDLRNGFQTHLPRLNAEVVMGPPPPASSGGSGGF